ncbi:four helix bundle protein [Chryseobacterium sp.]
MKNPRSSKADFKNKVKIALREARESHFWLRVLKGLMVMILRNLKLY